MAQPGRLNVHHPYPPHSRLGSQLGIGSRWYPHPMDPRVLTHHFAPPPTPYIQTRPQGRGEAELEGVHHTSPATDMGRPLHTDAC